MSTITKQHHKTAHTHLDGLFRYAEFLNFGEFHIKFDHATGLKAIVAIHNLQRGPAIGGCRLVRYHHADDALEDVMRLAYMMSYKAAVNNLPHGGAKSVIIMPKIIKDRTALFKCFGEFVDSLNGKYVTAIDSGTKTEDMDIIAEQTRYVTCTSKAGYPADPSPQTALGVRRAIEAAVKFKLNQNDISNIHILVQGAGHVGYHLAKELVERGAKVTMCDVNKNALDRCVDEFKVSAVTPEAIFSLNADVFAPCALGAVLNLQTINQLNVKIVAGSANNQLAHHHYASLLHDRDILYAPDFVINAGGLIYVSAIYNHADVKQAFQQVENLYETSIEIFDLARSEDKSTLAVAERLAKQRLKGEN